MPGTDGDRSVQWAIGRLDGIAEALAKSVSKLESSVNDQNERANESLRTLDELNRNVVEAIRKASSAEAKAEDAVAKATALEGEARLFKRLLAYGGSVAGFIFTFWQPIREWLRQHL